GTPAVAAIGLGGRPHAVIDLKVAAAHVGVLQTELVADFFEGFAIGARANVHLKVLYGRSSHHKIEAVFKAFARALRVATAKDKRLARMLPSTKGLLGSRSSITGPATSPRSKRRARHSAHRGSCPRRQPTPRTRPRSTSRRSAVGAR